MDLLKIDPIANCKIVTGDFTEDQVKEKLIKGINGEKFDVVLSDIAENSTGNRSLDAMRSNTISMQVMSFALRYLKKKWVDIDKNFFWNG